MGRRCNQTTYTSEIDRIEKNTKKTETCWFWTGFIDELGYGRCGLNGKSLKAHRLSYSAYKGSIPNGLFVLHKCDVRNCVNPEHLFLGTQIENIKDMVSKNRQKAPSFQGVKNAMAKLDDKKVREIRAHYKNKERTQKQISEIFKVSVMTVNRILNGKLWGHVE